MFVAHLRLENDFKVLGSDRQGKHGQSKSRRILAKVTFQVFFFFLLAAAVVYRFDAEYAKFLLALAGKIMFLVSAIGVIYFGPHQLRRIVKK